MADPASIPPQAPVSRTRGGARQLLVLALLLLIAGGAALAYYLWASTDYAAERAAFLESHKETPKPDIAYTVPGAEGSRWYLMREFSEPEEQAAFAGTITDIARGGGKTYLVASSAEGNGIYLYTGEAYDRVYLSASTLSSLAVAPDGDTLAFSEGGQIGVLSYGEVSWLGAGMNPVFVHVPTGAAIAYLSGPTVRLSSKSEAGWSESVALHTELVAFPSESTLISDGAGGHLAFSLPLTKAVRIVDLASPDMTPVQTDSTTGLPISAYVGGALASYQVTKDADGTGTTLLMAFSGTGETGAAIPLPDDVASVHVLAPVTP